MKKYYVIYGDFSNVYDLIWADESNEQYVPEGAERITRTKALELARAESIKRKTDENNSGYATQYIYPAEVLKVDGLCEDYMWNSRKYYLEGRIWECNR